MDDYRRAGLSIHTEIDPRAHGHEGALALVVTRVCGEALTSVTKHARDNVVQVSITIGQDRVVRLSVVDSGQAPPASNCGQWWVRSDRNVGARQIGRRNASR